jgi:hypothetical protein
MNQVGNQSLSLASNESNDASALIVNVNGTIIKADIGMNLI